MGSWVPKSWDENVDGPAPEHAIRCTAKWRGAPHTHKTTHDVRLCWAAQRFADHGTEVWPCSWLHAVAGEDGLYTVECGAPTVYTDHEGSYGCAAGHEHFALERQEREGIAYASDDTEAARLAGHGLDVRTMAGHVWPF